MKLSSISSAMFLSVQILSLWGYILDFRKVRHKNVVQFIGACTKPPNLCIVTGMKPENSSTASFCLFILSVVITK
jgi:hypothetical protein